MSVVPPLPVSPEPPPESVGESVGLSPPVSVGVAVGLSPPVSVGVADAVGVGDVSPTVGVADAVGTSPDVAGVGVTDGVGDAHVGVGDGDGDGDADGRRVRTSSSAVRSLAEAAVLATVAAGGTDEAGTVLVTSAVTDAAQVAEVVGRADAAPRDLVAPAPRAGPLAPDCAPPAP